MDNDVAVEIIKIIPNILRMLFLMVVFVIFYKPIRYQLIPRLTGFKLLGMEATFLDEEFDRAVVKQGIEVNKKIRVKVMQRAERMSSLLQGARVLWVDDKPENNTSEHRILRSFGIFLDIVQNTEDALALLKKTRYHVVVSDMKRADNPQEGLRFLSLLRKLPTPPPLIFYFKGFDVEKGIPSYSFGITNRPDQLIHYIMDALERVRD